VSFSPGFKKFLVLLLPLTLALKLVAGVEDAEDTYRLKDKILEVLAEHRFEVSVTDQTMAGMPIVRATMGSCHMLVGKASAFGWDRDRIRSLATNAADHVFIVFRGNIYAEQPTWLTAFNELWSRFLHKLSLARHVAPVIVVVATEACDAEHLPWNEVRESERPYLVAWPANLHFPELPSVKTHSFI